jgi:hypothetical protein
MLSEHKTNAMKKRFSCRAAKIWNEQDEDAGTEIVNELNLPLRNHYNCSFVSADVIMLACESSILLFG